jgi:hypothetical protein
MRRHFGPQPTGPADTLPGPRDCLRSKTVHGTCTKCGVRPEILHLPMKLHGWYCPEHCPCCNPMTEASAA